MAWYRCGGGGLPSGLQSDMDAVLNKKFSTSTTYPPTDWAPTVNLMGPLPEKTASGAIAHIEDGAAGVPVKNWLVTLPASLSGYSSIAGTKNTGTGTPETQYTASLGRTIYGGTADIVTGEGEETYPSIKISDLTFVKDANCQHTFRCTNLPREYGSGVYNIFSSAFTTYINGNSTGGTIASLEVGNDNTIFLNGGSATFYITADSSFDDKTATDFVNAYGNTELIYEASTPSTFTFTPITPTPETALGVSNFWADEGDSDVTYRADIDLLLGGQ